MIIENNHVKGIFLYTPNAEFEQGDFVISDGCIYICTAAHPTSENNTVSGIDPATDTTGNYTTYPGDKISTAQEYYEFVAGSDPVGEDKYVSSHVLCEILENAYFGISDNGIVSDYVLYHPSESIEYSVKGMSDYISEYQNVKVLDMILSETNLNNGMLRVSRDLPELLGIVTQEVVKDSSTILLKQHTYLDEEAQIRYRVQEIIDPIRGKEYYRYCPGVLKSGVWYYENPSPWKSSYESAEDSIMDELSLIREYYQEQFNLLNNNLDRRRFCYKEITSYLSGNERGNKMVRFTMPDPSPEYPDTCIVTVLVKRQYDLENNLYRTYSTTINLLDTEEGVEDRYYITDDNWLTVEINGQIAELNVEEGTIEDIYYRLYAPESIGEIIPTTTTTTEAPDVPGAPPRPVFSINRTSVEVGEILQITRDTDLTDYMMLSIDSGTYTKYTDPFSIVLTDNVEFRAYTVKVDAVEGVKFSTTVTKRYTVYPKTTTTTTIAPPTVNPPVFSLDSGTYVEGTTLTITKGEGSTILMVSINGGSYITYETGEATITLYPTTKTVSAFSRYYSEEADRYYPSSTVTKNYTITSKTKTTTTTTTNTPPPQPPKPEPLAAPVFSRESGSYYYDTMISVTDPNYIDGNTELQISLDNGKTFTSYSVSYTLRLTSAVTIQARVKEPSSGRMSTVSRRVYSVWGPTSTTTTTLPPPPTITKPTITIDGTQSAISEYTYQTGAQLTLNTGTGFTLEYSFDGGTTWEAFSGKNYSMLLNTPGDITVYARSSYNYYGQILYSESTISHTYSIVAPPAQPTFLVTAGEGAGHSYLSGFQITFTSGSTSLIIIKDGVSNSVQESTKTVTINNTDNRSTTVISARSVDINGFYSTLKTETYTFVTPPEPPSLSLPSGSYRTTQTLVVTLASDATKLYVSENNNLNYQAVVSPFSYTISSTTKKIYAKNSKVVEGYEFMSAEVLGDYIIVGDIKTPLFNIIDGQQSVISTTTYKTGVVLSIVSPDGNTIEYSLDNGETWSSGSSPIMLSLDTPGSVSIKARAIRTIGGQQFYSETVGASYLLIDPPAAPTYRINYTQGYPDVDTYYSGSTLELISDSGNSIRYSTTGAEFSTYSSPISLTSTTAIREVTYYVKSVNVHGFESVQTEIGPLVIVPTLSDPGLPDTSTFQNTKSVYIVPSPLADGVYYRINEGEWQINSSHENFSFTITSTSVVEAKSYMTVNGKTFFGNTVTRTYTEIQTSIPTITVFGTESTIVNNVYLNVGVSVEITSTSPDISYIIGDGTTWTTYEHQINLSGTGERRIRARSYTDGYYSEVAELTIILVNRPPVPEEPVVTYQQGSDFHKAYLTGSVLTYTAPTGCTIEYSQDGARWFSYTSPISMSPSITGTSTVVNYIARSVDEYGFTSETSITSTFVIVAKPASPGLDLSSGTYLSGSALHISNSSENYVVRYKNSVDNETQQMEGAIKAITLNVGSGNSLQVTYTAWSVFPYVGRGGAGEVPYEFTSDIVTRSYLIVKKPDAPVFAIQSYRQAIVLENLYSATATDGAVVRAYSTSSGTLYISQKYLSEPGGTTTSTTSTLSPEPTWDYTEESGVWGTVMSMGDRTEDFIMRFAAKVVDENGFSSDITEASYIIVREPDLPTFSIASGSTVTDGTDLTISATSGNLVVGTSSGIYPGGSLTSPVVRDITGASSRYYAKAVRTSHGHGFYSDEVSAYYVVDGSAADPIITINGQPEGPSRILPVGTRLSVTTSNSTDSLEYSTDGSVWHGVTGNPPTYNYTFSETGEFTFSFRCTNDLGSPGNTLQRAYTIVNAPQTPTITPVGVQGVDPHYYLIGTSFRITGSSDCRLFVKVNDGEFTEVPTVYSIQPTTAGTYTITAKNVVADGVETAITETLQICPKPVKPVITVTGTVGVPYVGTHATTYALPAYMMGGDLAITINVGAGTGNKVYCKINDATDYTLFGENQIVLTTDNLTLGENIIYALSETPSPQGFRSDYEMYMLIIVAQPTVPTLSVTGVRGAYGYTYQQGASVTVSPTGGYSLLYKVGDDEEYTFKETGSYTMSSIMVPGTYSFSAVSVDLSTSFTSNTMNNDVVIVPPTPMPEISASSDTGEGNVFTKTTTVIVTKTTNCTLYVDWENTGTYTKYNPDSSPNVTRVITREDGGEVLVRAYNKSEHGFSSLVSTFTVTLLDDIPTPAISILNSEGQPVSTPTPTSTIVPEAFVGGEGLVSLSLTGVVDPYDIVYYSIKNVGSTASETWTRYTSPVQITVADGGNYATYIVKSKVIRYIGDYVGYSDEGEVKATVVEIPGAPELTITGSGGIIQDGVVTYQGSIRIDMTQYGSQRYNDVIFQYKLDSSSGTWMNASVLGQGSASVNISEVGYYSFVARVIRQFPGALDTYYGQPTFKNINIIEAIATPTITVSIPTGEQGSVSAGVMTSATVGVTSRGSGSSQGSVVVDWGDGTTTDSGESTAYHNFTNVGTYIIRAKTRVSGVESEVATKTINIVRLPGDATLTVSGKQPDETYGTTTTSQPGTDETIILGNPSFTVTPDVGSGNFAQYSIDNGTWTDYTSPVSLPSKDGSSVSSYSIRVRTVYRYGTSGVNFIGTAKNTNVMSVVLPSSPVFSFTGPNGDNTFVYPDENAVVTGTTFTINNSDTDQSSTHFQYKLGAGNWVDYNRSAIELEVTSATGQYRTLEIAARVFVSTNGCIFYSIGGSVSKNMHIVRLPKEPVFSPVSGTSQVAGTDITITAGQYGTSLLVGPEVTSMVPHNSTVYMIPSGITGEQVIYYYARTVLTVNNCQFYSVIFSANYTPYTTTTTTIPAPGTPVFSLVSGEYDYGTALTIMAPTGNKLIIIKDEGSPVTYDEGVAFRTSLVNLESSETYTAKCLRGGVEGMPESRTYTAIDYIVPDPVFNLPDDNPIPAGEEVQVYVLERADKLTVRKTIVSPTSSSTQAPEDITGNQDLQGGYFARVTVDTDMKLEAWASKTIGSRVFTSRTITRNYTVTQSSSSSTLPPTPTTVPPVSNPIFLPYSDPAQSSGYNTQISKGDTVTLVLPEDADYIRYKIGNATSWSLGSDGSNVVLQINNLGKQTITAECRKRTGSDIEGTSGTVTVVYYVVDSGSTSTQSPGTTSTP